MARTTNTKTEIDAVSTPVAESNVQTKAEKENEQLKNEIAELRAQMASFMSQFTNTSVVPESTTLEENEEQDIEIINLSPSYLVLTTTGKSNGFHYEVEKQFDSVYVPESDLKQIVRAMPNATKGGLYYINNEQFVKKNNLSSAYRKILNNLEIAKMINESSADFASRFNSLSREQKLIVEKSIINKKLMGEPVDANILVELSKITGKDYFGIEPLESEV